MPFSLFIDGLNNNDFRIRRGRFVLSTGAEAARNRILVALNTQLGEWFLDTRQGIPYYGDNGIMGGRKSAEEIAAIFRMAVLSDPEVDRMDEFEIVEDINNPRGYNISMTLTLNATGPDGTSEQISIEV